MKGLVQGAAENADTRQVSCVPKGLPFPTAVLFLTSNTPPTPQAMVSLTVESLSDPPLSFQHQAQSMALKQHLMIRVEIIHVDPSSFSLIFNYRSNSLQKFDCDSIM